MSDIKQTILDMFYTGAYSPKTIPQIIKLKYGISKEQAVKMTKEVLTNKK